MNRSLLLAVLAAAATAPLATAQLIQLPIASRELTLTEYAPGPNPPPPAPTPTDIGYALPAQCTPDLVPDVVYRNGPGVWMLYAPLRHGALPVSVTANAAEFAVFPNANADGTDGVLTATAAGLALHLWDDSTKAFSEHSAGALALPASQVKVHSTAGGMVSWVVVLTPDRQTLRPVLYRQAGGGVPAHVFHTGLPTVGLSTEATSFVLADLDADGTPEIGVEYDTGLFEVLDLGDGSLWFQVPGAQPGGVMTAFDDADDPHRQWIARVATLPPAGLTVLYTIGANGPTQANLLTDVGDVVGIAAADGDLDGDQDLCVSISEAPGASLLENVQGTLSDDPDFSDGTLPLSAGVHSDAGAWPIFADLDNDGEPGDPDVILFDSESTNARYMENGQINADNLRVSVKGFDWSMQSGDLHVELELLPPATPPQGGPRFEIEVWGLDGMGEALDAIYIDSFLDELPTGHSPFTREFTLQSSQIPSETTVFFVVLTVVRTNGNDVSWRFPARFGVFSPDESTFQDLTILYLGPPPYAEGTGPSKAEPPGGGWVPVGDVGPFPIRP